MGLFSDEDTEAVTVQGKPLRCQVCQNDRFWQQKAQLHSGFATFFDVEWASPTCTCVICSSCRYVHWFFPEA
jgi:predicted nucleic-acid-binding Zn-ribbon protein